MAATKQIDAMTAATALGGTDLRDNNLDYRELMPQSE